MEQSSSSNRNSATEELQRLLVDYPPDVAALTLKSERQSCRSRLTLPKRSTSAGEGLGSTIPPPDTCVQSSPARRTSRSVLNMETSSTTPTSYSKEPASRSVISPYQPGIPLSPRCSAVSSTKQFSSADGPTTHSPNLRPRPVAAVGKHPFVVTNTLGSLIDGPS